MNSFSALGPVQFVAIAIGGVFLTALCLFFLLREQKSIQAVDGTRFSSEEACRAYEEVLERINTLYLNIGKKPTRDMNLGFHPDFLTLLKNEGFKEVKTLMTYRDDFKRLVELFD